MGGRSEETGWGVGQGWGAGVRRRDGVWGRGVGQGRGWGAGAGVGQGMELEAGAGVGRWGQSWGAGVGGRGSSGRGRELSRAGATQAVSPAVSLGGKQKAEQECPHTAPGPPFVPVPPGIRRQGSQAGASPQGPSGLGGPHLLPSASTQAPLGRSEGGDHCCGSQGLIFTKTTLTVFSGLCILTVSPGRGGPHCPPRRAGTPVCPAFCCLS